MDFDKSTFEQILPPFLHNTAKGRIHDALLQFSKLEGQNINYDHFYDQSPDDYPMQADVFHSMKGFLWNEETGEVENGFNPCMLISNSCDVSNENARTLNKKDVLLAPLIPLNEFLEDCQQRNYTTSQISNFVTLLKRQDYTNLFYLPPAPGKSEEYFIRLDRIYWLPVTEFSKASLQLKDSRFLSLSQWAWYLFIVKLSLHTCRTPEEVERKFVG